MQNRSVILRIVVLALLLYALASLCSRGWELRETERRLLVLEEEQRELERQKQELEAGLAGEGRQEELRRLARERLGMVMPGEIIFYFTGSGNGPGDR